MIDAENPEWTKEDFARALHFSQLPESLQAKLSSLKKPRAPQKAPTKEVVTIRLSRDGGAAACHWPRMADASGHGFAAMD